MFSSEPRKSQIVPVLPAASREAGRTVTTADVTPAQKKSGMISSVRPAVQSGMRPSVQSGLHPAMTASGVATAILPRIEEKKFDGKTVALVLIGGLLVINMALTAVLLLNADRANPELIEQKVQLQMMQEEFARLRAETEKSLNHASTVVNQLQLDSDMIRGQVHVINQKAVDQQRATGRSPHDTDEQK